MSFKTSAGANATNPGTRDTLVVFPAIQGLVGSSTFMCFGSIHGHSDGIQRISLDPMTLDFSTECLDPMYALDVQQKTMFWRLQAPLK